MKNKKKKYSYKDVYIKYAVGYTTEEDRNKVNYFYVMNKSIDKALKQAKIMLKLDYPNLKNPTIVSLEFEEYCTNKRVELIYAPNDKVWYELYEYLYENKKKENKPLDTSCWYIDPSNVNARVFNQNGDIVELNTEQSNSDYEFFKQLHLNEDNTITEYGVTRYTTVCPMIYECIVYGHNYRYGYIKDKTNSLTEAILHIRVNYTKLSKDDDPRKEH